MRLEKGVISSSQLMFLVTGLIQGSALTVAFITKIAKQDIWLVVLSGLVISLFLALIYISLAQKFPSKNLIQINDIIYGPYVGKLISALYLYFFLLIIPANLRFIGDFSLTYLMPETPMSVILIMFMFICAWAVRKGIEVIARTSIILVVITIIISLFTFVLLLKDMQLTNFLPILELSLKDYIQSTHIMMAIPFGEVLVFFMVIPYVNNIKQAKSSVLLGLIIGGLTILSVTVKFIAVLGITSTIMTSPYFEAVRLIDIAGIITRLEILVAIGLLITVFLKVSIFYYATVLGIAQLLNLRSYLPLVLPIGIICISLSFFLYASPVEEVESAVSIWPIWSIPFELLFPLSSLLIAKIRRLPKKQGG